MVGTIFQGTVGPSEILSAPGAWEGNDRFMELANYVLTVVNEQERLNIIYEMQQIITKAVPFYGTCDITTVYAITTDIKSVDFYQGALRYQELSFS